MVAEARLLRFCSAALHGFWILWLGEGRCGVNADIPKVFLPNDFRALLLETSLTRLCLWEATTKTDGRLSIHS